MLDVNDLSPEDFAKGMITQLISGDPASHARAVEDLESYERPGPAAAYLAGLVCSLLEQFAPNDGTSSAIDGMTAEQLWRAILLEASRGDGDETP